MYKHRIIISYGDSCPSSIIINPFSDGSGKSQCMTGSEEFGQGMSVAKRKNFRQFYPIFPDVGKHYPLRSELSWS
jgi:hypothetical protein